MFVGALLCSYHAQGQPANELQIKAVFVYNFTQFIEWPAHAFESPEDPFVIGILGARDFGKYLEEAVAGESYHARPIVIKYYPTIRDVGNCHILYVGSLVNIAKLTSNKPVLTVGERAEFMEQKGMLRFYHEGNKVRIEINQGEASASGLTISSKLLRLASIYRRK